MKVIVAKQMYHERILELAKVHACTRDFGHMMFSGPEAYEKGWIRMAIDPLGPCWLLGFTCVRHKVRSPETSLYFIGVHPNHRSAGVGTALLEDLKQSCPNPRIVLNVRKDNPRAVAFYSKHGFSIDGESLKGEGFRMSLEWRKP